MSAPRVLFVPVSGKGGAGEFVRSLVLARAVMQRWPAARVHFVVNSESAYARDVPFAHTTIEGSPTYNVAAVNAVLEREHPDVVVFDSSGRIAQYRYAHRVGACVVYVSSRFKTRWKGFRLRRMRHLDQHWIVHPRCLGGRLSRWERLKLWLIQRVETLSLDTVFDPPDERRRARLESELGLAARSYAVFCAGSGGVYKGAQDASEVFAAAAREVQRFAGLDCVVVAGPNSRLAAGHSKGVRVVSALENARLMDLLTGARIAVVNGGSLLVQALANRCATVAAPVAGDQAARIQRCADLGLVAPAALDAAEIARAVTVLLGDDAARACIERALDATEVGNGVPAAMAALARLIERGA